MKREKRAAIAKKVENTLDIPVGVLSRAARMEVSGNRQVLIEGCRGIVRYDEDQIEVRTADGTVRFTGREMCMTSLNPACAVITGRLLSVEFL
ncbi:MAG: YabP/YqfC family sporulation protein [Clostridia bacterium]|nr:YabP/YqfC family sporulation protein [Clostridia bacterium]